MLVYDQHTVSTLPLRWVPPSDSPSTGCSLTDCSRTCTVCAGSWRRRCLLSTRRSPTPVPQRPRHTRTQHSPPPPLEAVCREKRGKIQPRPSSEDTIWCTYLAHTVVEHVLWAASTSACMYYSPLPWLILTHTYIEHDTLHQSQGYVQCTVCYQSPVVMQSAVLGCSTDRWVTTWLHKSNDATELSIVDVIIHYNRTRDEHIRIISFYVLCHFQGRLFNAVYAWLATGRLTWRLLFVSYQLMTVEDLQEALQTAWVISRLACTYST